MQTNKMEMIFNAGGGTSTHTFYQYSANSSNNIMFLEALDGWDELNNFSVQTEPKLFGKGSYILGRSEGEKILQITVSFLANSEISLRTFRDDLVYLASQHQSVQFKRTIYREQDVQKRFETMNGEITAITLWDQTNFNASIRFTVLCTDPTLNVTYEGQTPTPPPEIYTANPMRGYEPGGESVIITGKNFTGTGGVNFGTKAAQSFTVNSDTQITAIAPSGVGNVKIAVLGAPGGNAVSAFNYSYDPVPVPDAPLITSFSPNIGFSDSETVVTINGANFLEISSVKFGNIESPNWSLSSNSVIVAKTPINSAGQAVKISVTGTYGTGISDSNFIYQERPPVDEDPFGSRAITWLKFNDSLEDSTPNNLDASAFNGVSYTDGPGGKAQRAVVFDGNNWLSWPAFYGEFGNSGYTFSAFVKFNTIIPYSRIYDFSVNGQANDNVLLAPIENNVIVSQTFYGSQGSTQNINYTLVDGEWHMLTLTIATSGMYRFFVDGQLDTQGYTDKVPRTQSYFTNLIGQSNWAPLDPLFQGAMSNFRIWDRNLASWEVQSLYDYLINE